MFWIRRFVFVIALLPMAMCQAQAEKYQAGVHYELLPQPVRTANPDKIEVNEVFSYTCSHCYSFEDVVMPWKKQLPADVDFQRTPAVWGSNMEPYARAYYGALMLDQLDLVHRPLFEAFHLKKQRFSTAEDFAELFVSKGVDGDAFSRAYNSFGMTSMVNQAKARVRSYRVQGTPEMVINGKYRISTRKAGGFTGMLSVADFLIEKERALKAK
jgi:thiol:disulfide interchange protein DsbA